ncbi:MAG: SDR family oxidoreductase [Gammaproteobacteria bacterium]|nr:SDR family oxidoreductase [Gammaproteobacteria bacterium]
METPLANKVALVTGGSSGLGLAIALGLAKSGAQVVIASRRIDEGNAAVKEIEKQGHQSIFIQADVSSVQDIEKLMKAIQDQFGRLDIAVNNAGFSGPMTLLDNYLEADWDKVMDTNAKGVAFCMKEELRIMKAQKSGVIINIASLSGIRAEKMTPVYGASKYAIVGLTQSVAKAVAADNIRVIAICPGPIDSEKLQKMAAGLDFQAMIKQRIPMQRVAQAEEVANAVVWLCGDSANYITGIALPVDGGQSI